MRLARELKLRFNPSTGTVLSIMVLANVTVALLWLLEVDRGAMTVLLVPLVFALTAFVCYLLDPVGGKSSLVRGYMVGGLSVVIWLPWVVIRSWIEKGEIAHPNWAWFMLPLFLALGALFGAAVGSITAVIGGFVLRAIGMVFKTVIETTSGSKSGKDTDRDVPQFF
jgi:hypothetical protein